MKPNPFTFKELKNNCKLNNLNNIALNNLALSNEESTMDLYFPTELGDAYGSLAKNFPGENSTIICDVITLDKYIQSRNIRKVHFLKIDVEGAELRVLEGSRNTLGNFKPILAIEIHEVLYKYFGYSLTDLFAFLRGIGYSIYGLNQKELYEITSEDTSDSRLIYCLTPNHLRNYR